MQRLAQLEVLAHLLDSLREAVVLLDASGRVLFINHAAQELLKADLESAVGQELCSLTDNREILELFKSSRYGEEQTLSLNARTLRVYSAAVRKNEELVAVALVFRDVTELAEISKQLEEMSAMKSTLETILDNAYEGIVVVDANGFITMLNKPYAEFLGVKPEDAVGKHVTEVIENTRMHIVVKTGVAEVGHVQRIRGHNTVVMRVPIFKDGKVIGAVGKVMFRDVQEVRALLNKLNLLEEQVEFYKEELKKIRATRYSLDSIVGESRAIKAVKAMIERAARSNSTVLILGESGTGKELVANAIHKISAQRDGPFVKINCAAIPESLLESELFGYAEGAFTGAKAGGKPGKFELANGGTIFLDEIGDMSPSVQAKLLRVLQEREVERIGSNKPVKINARIIAATNQDLESKIRTGAFRADLYYRLNVLTIKVPPLRERIEDIPLLVSHFIEKFNKVFGAAVQDISPQALSILLHHSWPGNVRELENVVERAFNVMEGCTILPEHLPDYLLRQAGKQSETCPLSSLLAESEKEAIIAALKAANGNRTRAAKLLGIHRSGLYQKLKKYNINPSSISGV